MIEHLPLLTAFFLAGPVETPNLTTNTAMRSPVSSQMEITIESDGSLPTGTPIEMEFEYKFEANKDEN